MNRMILLMSLVLSLLLPLLDVSGWFSFAGQDGAMPVTELTFSLQELVVDQRTAGLLEHQGIAAWAVIFVMGMQSLTIYTTVAWLPTILSTQGFSASTAGLGSAVFLLVSAPASIMTAAFIKAFIRWCFCLMSGRPSVRWTAERSG